MKARFDAVLTDLYAEADFKHPLLTIARFIFTDDKPNKNNQGIEYEDFEAIKQSAIDMPVKMRFLGEAGAAGHSAAVTIGHIRAMFENTLEDGTHQLIAEAALYTAEYPNEVEYLQNAYAEGKAPGSSWEIDYKEEKKSGLVSWLKNVTTRAATFVRNPAYGTRTALLALASDNLITDEDLGKKLEEMVTEINKPKNTVEGGSNKVEKELEELQVKLDKALAEIESLTTEKETLSTAKAELEAQVSSKDEVISTYQKKELVADRTAKIAATGLKMETDPEKLAKKQDFWTGLSEEAFAEYIEDITLASKQPEKPKTGLASLRSVELPRPAGNGTDAAPSLADIKNRFRTLSRVPSEE